MSLLRCVRLQICRLRDYLLCCEVASMLIHIIMQFFQGYVLQDDITKTFLCEACGKALRGKSRLQKLEQSHSFSCVLGQGKNRLMLPLLLTCIYEQSYSIYTKGH